MKRLFLFRVGQIYPIFSWNHS